jgi:hypothetical protein
MLRGATLLALALLAGGGARAQWTGYAGNAQHTAISSVAADSLQTIRWSTPVDESNPGSPIYIHYGSPLITTANTVVVPVREADGSFRIDARSGSDGALLWHADTPFVTAPSSGNWVPSFGPTLTPAGQLFFQGIGGTVYRVANPNDPASTPVPINFLPDYSANSAAYNSSVFISTPLTSDAAGNIYFGFETTSSAPGGLSSGIARITPAGVATYVSADSASGTSLGGFRVGTNSALAVSNDGTTIYAALNGGSNNLLASIDAATLAPEHHAALSGVLLDAGTSSPTVAPDGRVFMGSMYGYHFRGTMNQFSADLSQTFAPGSFGWDITPSIVPASAVPGYHGSSTYLLLVKYNDYAGFGGGTGQNRMAILDPNDTQFDPLANADTMKEVLTILGPTPDPGGGVTEWCVNTAAVDPLTKSVLVNSEDGWLYRWDLTTNTFTEKIQLQADGALEAYTPTLIGSDGAVYAINKARLFSVVPEPNTGAFLELSIACLTFARLRCRKSSRLNPCSALPAK